MIDTVEYTDGSSATGVAPLPRLSPSQQRMAELEAALELAVKNLSYIQQHAPGYDWNADPLYLTLKSGEVFEAARNVISAQGELNGISR